MSLPPLMPAVPAESPLPDALGSVLARFESGTVGPEIRDALHRLAEHVRRGDAPAAWRRTFDGLCTQGYLNEAIARLAEALRENPDPDGVLVLAATLADAVAPDRAVALAQACLTLPAVDREAREPGSAFVRANLLLGESLLQSGRTTEALRHFEAIMAVDVDHARALRGFATAHRRLHGYGAAPSNRGLGLALLDGLEDVEHASLDGTARYDLGRPLGRGRHAVVYAAYDRNVGRDVAIKRLLPAAQQSGPGAAQLVHRRFFDEAATLANIRSPHVVALYDVQPQRRFIAMELCAGGNLRQALRRGTITSTDMPRIACELRLGLSAVHASGALHRDVKPVNILLRDNRPDSEIVLADLGLAVRSSTGAALAGTVRYLAPEMRQTGAAPTQASDWFSAGVVLLQIARHPDPLPAPLDDLARPPIFREDWLPAGIAPSEANLLRRLLQPDPEARSW